MGLTELLEQIRNDYVDQLSLAIDERQAVADVRVIAEPALRDENSRLATDGVLQLPARTDIAIIENEELADMYNVEADRTIDFDAVEFDWGKTLHVEMGPFAWQALSITMPADESYVWTPMQDWFWKWFHEEDEADSSELSGAVHFLSDPIVEGDVVQMQADLGSAPIAAFEEMLDAVSASGVSLCAIGIVQGATGDE